LADVALGLDHQSHEDGIEQTLNIRVGGRANGLAGFAKFDDSGQQPFAVARIAAARQCQKLSGLDGLDDQPPRIPNLVRMTLPSLNENMLKQLERPNHKNSGALSQAKR
jgi:hypothetical protein